MIDKFNELATSVATAVRSAHSGTWVTGERTAKPAHFPCVAIVEADRVEDARRTDNSLKENTIVMLVEITVFSNKTSERRSECIGILATASDVLKQKNGRMISKVEGYLDQDSTIYMVQARYRLATDGTYWYTY